MVDEEAVTQVLRDVPFEALDNLGAARLVGAHHLAEVLRAETARQRRRSDEVAEEHGELAALLARRLRRDLPDRRGRARRGPDEQLALLVDSQPLGVDDLVLERLEDVIVELEADFQRAIGHAPLAAEQIDDLHQEIVEIHRHRSSPARTMIFDKASDGKAWRPRAGQFIIVLPGQSIASRAHRRGPRPAALAQDDRDYRQVSSKHAEAGEARL